MQRTFSAHLTQCSTEQRRITARFVMGPSVLRCSRALALPSTRVVPFLSTSYKLASVSYHISKSRERRLIVRSGWGAPVEWAAARIVQNSPAAEQLQRIQLDIGERVAGYTAAGQFVQVRVAESKPGFFAIASPPDPNNAGVIELLVKEAGETAEALCKLEAGAAVEVSPVMGKGFPVERVPASSYPTLLLFATGSGISPIRALIESGKLEADKRQQVSLYYGTRNPQCMAYRELIPDWEAAGVTVFPVFSEEGQGYVQHVFAQNGGLAEGSRAAVVLCGQKDMCTAVTELVTAMGISKDDVLLNF